MKVIAFFLCILFLASCSNQDQSNTSVDKQEALKLEQNVKHLYAQIGFENKNIELGKIVSFDNNQILYFINQGDTTLVINEVYTESDRIEVYGYSYEVAPGEQGRIRLKISPSLEHKNYSDYLYIRTNSNQTPSLARLEINYEISNDLIIGGFFVEDNDRINVRMFPSLEATVIFGLEKGDNISCIGAMHKDYVEDFDSDLWYYVEYKGRKGWVLSALTDFKQQEAIAMK